MVKWLISKFFRKEKHSKLLLQDIHARILIAALSKNWKQPQHPAIGCWLGKLHDSM